MKPEVLSNPTIQLAVKAEEAKDKLVVKLADLLLSTTTWENMSPSERLICLRALALRAESEDEFQQLLLVELGLGKVAISWYLPTPGNQTDEEARVLMKALGGLISKNGALINVLTVDGKVY